jgi:hypothetical protein
MRKEELDRRSAEMKARLLAQRAAKVHEQLSNVRVRKSAMKQKQGHGGFVIKPSDGEEVSVLRNEIAKLEAENKNLRQITELTRRAAQPSRSAEDSVRDQRHNFFKYSNVRRY